MRSRALLLRSCLLAACCLLCAVPGVAGPVTLNLETWQTAEITLLNAGDFFPDAFIAAATSRVTVSGYWVTGEFYTINVNGSPVLTTTQVLPADVNYGDPPINLYRDPKSAFASHLFSSGQFLVKQGDVITIQDLHPPGGIGEVGLFAEVPEPGSFLLLGIGAAALAHLRRRKWRPSR